MPGQKREARLRARPPGHPFLSEATMSGLTFTEDAARHLARVYLTPDVVAQRVETMKQLALSPGERVLDVGCGPGFLCESIAAAVGGDGAVTGIDISGDLIALCRSRNPPQWLSYAVGDATKIAQPDASLRRGGSRRPAANGMIL